MPLSSRDVICTRCSAALVRSASAVGLLTRSYLADSVVPSLSCKKSVTVELGASEPLTTGAMDVSGSAIVSCQANTADLPVGANQPVVCTATDASDNEARCTVDVSVVGALVCARRPSCIGATFALRSKQH